MFSALRRSRKARHGTDLVCEWVFRPLAHPVVLALLPLRVSPPLVVCASGAAGIGGAVELARGHLVVAALLIQLKTVLDNADGQLARLSGRVTEFGRYLDSEVDLLVDAALLAALGWETGHGLAAFLAFLGLTAVLSVNFNAERLYRLEHEPGRPAAAPAGGRATAFVRRVYGLVYAPQDRLVERFAAWRLRDAHPNARLAYHDRVTVFALANLGMSTQLAALGVCLMLGRPLTFVWLVAAEVVFVTLLALRRELLLRSFGALQEEAL